MTASWRRSTVAAVLAGLAWAGPAWARGPQTAGTAETVGIDLEALMFYLLGGLAAACAVGCVMSSRVVRMALFLFGALGAVAGLYLLLHANFLAAVQLIVYAGGTLVVIIFGIMLSSASAAARYQARPAEKAAGAVVGLLLLAGLVTAVGRIDWSGRIAAVPSAPTVLEFGRALLTTYLVPFELSSVLLLAVMIGAAWLAGSGRR